MLQCSRGDQNISKNSLGGKREFVKMCQVRRPKQPLKVPTTRLGRSLKCGTFATPPLPNHIFEKMKSYKKMFGTKNVPREISYPIAFSKVSLGLIIALKTSWKRSHIHRARQKSIISVVFCDLLHIYRDLYSLVEIFSAKSFPCEISCR